MTTLPLPPGARSLTILAVVRVVLAVAAAVFVAALIVSGLDPRAELGGVLALIGAMLALPVLGYLTLALLCLVAAYRGRPRAISLSWALATVDTLVGAAFLAALAYAAIQRDSLAGSPLFFGLTPLVTGIAGLITVVKRRRPPHAPVGAT